MANIFRAKSLISRTGVFSDEVLSPNLIYNTGDQTISGSKTFFDPAAFSTSQAEPFILSNNPLSVVGSGDYFLQLNIQNRGTGSAASSDLVLTSDNGTEVSNYIDLGINSSQYNNSDVYSLTTGNDGYLYINGGNLVIGTQTDGKVIKFHVNGSETGDQVAEINTEGVIAANLVYNTSNQNINGIKNFLLRPTVNGTGVLLSGEAASLPTTIVYTTGNQSISGNKTFNNTLSVGTISGLSAPYGSPSIHIKGLNNGTDFGGLFVGGYVEVIGGSGNNGGGNVSILGGDTSNQKYGGLINLIGGQVNINNDNTASRPVTFYKTGASSPQQNLSINQNSVDVNNDFKISGVLVTPNSYATIVNLASTGLTLTNNITSLSGLFTGYTGNLDSTFASDIQLFNTGVTLNNRINSLSGVSVLAYGNQNITGNKTFINNLEIQGTGIFNALDLSNISEFNFSGTNINLISGNVNVSGQIYISGNPVLTGVNLSSYATTANLASTGSTLATNLAGTGSTLVSSINSLSGLFTGFTGNLDAAYATDTQLASTGSTLQTNINNLSGVAVLTFRDQTISGIKTFEDSIKTKNIISSDNENLLISGFSSAMVGSNINITPGKTSFSKGSINLTAAGDQVDGNINFKGNVDINNYGEGDSVFTDVYPSGANHSFKIYKSGLNSYTKRVSYKSFEVNQSGVYTLNKTPIYADAQIYISGNPVSTGVDLSSYATTSNLALTGLNLSNNINSLSGLFTGFTGTLDGTFATDIQLFTTGSTLDNKINSLSGVSVLTYGNQNISGTKNFIDNVNFSGTGTFNAIDLNNIDNLSLSGVDVTLTDSIINVNRNIFISGNPVLTGVNLTPYATTVNLALTGLNLSNNISSLSGLFTGYTGNLDSTFASDTQLFNTGVTLNNTITSLSGTLTGNYVTKSNGLFTNTPTVNGTNILLSGERITSGDLTGYLPYPTVNKLQGYQVDLSAAPADGQILQWNAGTSSWKAGAIPVGGNGGGGRVYYFDFANRTGIAPTGGLPTTGDHALSLLGREYAIGSGQAISNELDPRFVDRLLCSFVTASGDPAVSNIPAGLWDFNIWASVNSASTVQCSIRAVANIYNPTNSTYRYLASTDDVYLYETDTIAQYILNATVPQTGIANDERIYIQLFGKKYTTNNRNITLYFDSYRPSHVHTTIPSVAGNGVVKVVNGVYQTPATNIFDSDVDNAANISQSKIANLSSDLTTIRNTGTALDLKIGALSGTLTNNYLTTSSASTTYATIANLASTGSTLATNLANTGSTLQTNINNLSNTYATITNVGLTGITLNNNITSLSGLFTGFTGNLDTSYATDLQVTNTGITLNTRINNLSGYINSTSSNIVFTTGNQTISGVKTFVQDATFGDTGQGDFLVISGNNFTVYGSGNFTSGLFVNGNAVLTGVNLTPYATTANLAITGNTLTNNITSLSGLFTGYTGTLDNTYATDIQLFNTGSTLQTNINNLSSTYATITNLASTGSTLATNLANTGSTLNSNIISLSGLFTGYTGTLDNTYATDIQLFNTGSTLQTNINNLSSTYATITNVGLTGSTLTNNITSLSGLFTGYTGNLDLTFATDLQVLNTGITLNTTINNLSGYINSTNSNILYTTGNQTVTGIKTFRDTILVDQSSVILSGAALNLVTKIVTGSTVTVTQPDYAETQVIDYIEGDLAITRGVNGGPYNPVEQGAWDGIGPTYTTWNTEGWNDLSNIQSRTYVASMQSAMGENFNNIPNYYFVMRDTYNNRYYKLKFNSWQVGAGQEGGYKGFSYTRTLLESISPQINGSNVGGNLNLSNRLFINGTGVLLSGEAGQVPNTIVQTSGAQTISGIKTFNAPTIFNSGTTFNSAATFNNNITVAQTGIFNSMDVYVDEMNISGLNLVLTSGSGIFSFLNINGNYDIYSQIENSKKLAIAYAIAL
jgi:hypothetical protein